MTSEHSASESNKETLDPSQDLQPSHYLIDSYKGGTSKHLINCYYHVRLEVCCGDEISRFDYYRHFSPLIYRVICEWALDEVFKMRFQAQSVKFAIRDGSILAVVDAKKIEKVKVEGVQQ